MSDPNDPRWTFTQGSHSISFSVTRTNEESPLWKAPARVSERPLIGTDRATIDIFGRSAPRMDVTALLYSYSDYTLTVETLDGTLGTLDRGHSEESPQQAVLLVTDQHRIVGSDLYRLAITFIIPG